MDDMNNPQDPAAMPGADAPAEAPATDAPAEAPATDAPAEGGDNAGEGSM